MPSQALPLGAGLVAASGLVAGGRLSSPAHLVKVDSIALNAQHAQHRAHAPDAHEVEHPAQVEVVAGRAQRKRRKYIIGGIEGLISTLRLVRFLPPH